MPFGLKGAPSCFQRLMDDILSDIPEFCRPYLDDIIIFSNTWEEHFQHFLQVVTNLKHHGLILKNYKCQIGMTSFVVSWADCWQRTNRTIDSKSRSSMNQLVTKIHMRVFLGLAGYYCRFILAFSATAAGPTYLTKKTAPIKVEWTIDCQQALQKLKNS